MASCDLGAPEYRKFDIEAWMPGLERYGEVGEVGKASLLTKQLLYTNCTPNQVTYGCFLDYFTREGNMGSAMDLHKFMLEGMLANTVTYNILSRGLSKQGMVDKAANLIFEMMENGIKPDCVSYSIIMYEYCRGGDRGEGIRLWESMLSKGVSPDQVAYNILIYGFCIAGDLGMASELREDMLRRGVRPGRRRQIYHQSEA